MKYGIEIFVLYMTREKGNYLKNNELLCVCVCIHVHGKKKSEKREEREC